MLETVFIEMDPVLDGFEGVLVELSFTGEKYRLILTAAGSGNHVLLFTSEDPALVNRVIYLLQDRQICSALQTLRS